MTDIIVLVKQVPDIEEVKFDREEGRIDRSSAEAETNPFDLNALEEAVRFKEEIGGNIVAISMGPPAAESTLKDTLSRGADRAILLTDKAFAAADTWATALTLSTAIRKLVNFDLIICGEKTVDGDTGQVGPEVAEILDIPHIANVSEVLKRNETSSVVVSEIWGRNYVKRLEFPALITVCKDVNEPRLPSFQDKMKARKAEIDIWEFKDLAELLNEEDVGLKGSRTSVKKIEVAHKVERRGEIFRGESSETVRELISRMEENGILEGSGVNK